MSDAKNNMEEVNCISAGAKNIPSGMKNKMAGAKNIMAATGYIFAGVKNSASDVQNKLTGVKNKLAGVKNRFADAKNRFAVVPLQTCRGVFIFSGANQHLYFGIYAFAGQEFEINCAKLGKEFHFFQRGGYSIQKKIFALFGECSRTGFVIIVYPGCLRLPAVYPGLKLAGLTGRKKAIFQV